MEAAQTAFATWSQTPAAERAGLLFRAAALIRERKFEFCAWLVYEVGKNWAEADADVGETIDFLEFYGREALRLDGATTPIQFPGERNQLRYIPLGVGAVIPPWNFPFAIMAGMTAAAIVCGNTVILKPSVDAPTIAATLHEPARRGRPARRRRQPLPRRGRRVRQRSGRASADPLHRLHRLEGRRPARFTSAPPRTQPGQIFIKRTILEMGGKDSIIVDADCDLDAAVEGVVASAFGFNGQKCSACSRAIVDADDLRRLLRPAAANGRRDQDRRPGRERLHRPGHQREGLPQGPRATSRSARTRAASSTAATRSRPPEGGYYIAPTVIADVAPTARIAQEEIFGPVLAVIKSQNFDDALAIANNTEYGLTGAIYSNSRENLERARRGVPRRQSLLQPQVHRRDGRRASLRRLQHERHRLQGRRPRLSAAVHPGQEHRGKDGAVSSQAEEQSAQMGEQPGLDLRRLHLIRFPAFAAASARTRW